MTTYDVIGRIDPDEDHPSVFEAVEKANAELGGDFSILANYEYGQGNSTEYLLVEERDDDE